MKNNFKFSLIIIFFAIIAGYLIISLGFVNSAKASSEERFCTLQLPAKFHIEYNLRSETVHQVKQIYGQTWILITEDFVKSLAQYGRGAMPHKEYYRYDRKTEKIISAVFNYDYNRWDRFYSADGDYGHYRYKGSVIHPPSANLYYIIVDEMTAKKGKVSGIECYLTKEFDKMRQCVSREYCMVVKEFFTEDFFPPGPKGRMVKKGEDNFEVISITSDFDQKILEIELPYSHQK